MASVFYRHYIFKMQHASLSINYMEILVMWNTMCTSRKHGTSYNLLECCMPCLQGAGKETSLKLEDLDHPIQFGR